MCAHRVIIIESATPPTPSIAETHDPEFRVRVEYRPSDSMTPDQIGKEVARIQRRTEKIIDGTAD
jgi:hypothetical protein